jgi:hypothetical protein
MAITFLVQSQTVCQIHSQVWFMIKEDLHILEGMVQGGEVFLKTLGAILSSFTSKEYGC